MSTSIKSLHRLCNSSLLSCSLSSCSGRLRSFSSSSSALGSSARIPAIVTPLPVRPPVVAQNIYESAIASIGNTALIKLRGPSELTGCNIYGKCEFQNPGGSVKDRAGYWIIKDAEEKGLLQPGKPGIIVEGTAGNTGIGLTIVGNARGYKTIIVIADSQSQEKKDTLRQCGAELIEVPAVPFKNPLNYVHQASRLAAYLTSKYPGQVLYANQWDNLSNRRAHIESTGPEIDLQLGGKIDAFSCAMGTGGTLSGIAEYFRSSARLPQFKSRPIPKIYLTDPQGAALVHYYKYGELKASGDSISEGIGQARITGNMRAGNFRPDECYEITDAESLPVLFDLLNLEGLSVGSSSMINVAGAIKVAKNMGPGKTIVTMLCDFGSRYASKIYNPNFLKARNLPIPQWLDEEKTSKDRFFQTLKQDLKEGMRKAQEGPFEPIVIQP